MTTSVASAPRSRGSLVSRLVVTVVAAGGLAAVTWADAVGLADAPAMAWLLPLAVAAAAAGGHEAVQLAGAAGISLDPVLVPLGAAAIAAAPAVAAWIRQASPDPFATVGPAAAACMAVVAGGFVAGVAGYGAGRRQIVRVAGSVAAAISLGLPLAFMVAIRLLPIDAAEGKATSVVPLVSLIAVVKAGDIAAYVVGSLVGRRRMAPALSPGKTWEGAAASIAASIVVAWAVLSWGGLSAAPLGGWPLYGAAVGIAGMLGDLSESLVKRDLEAKDSGRILGGMGGFLDLVDSLLIAAPVAWALWIAGAA